METAKKKKSIRKEKLDIEKKYNSELSKKIGEISKKYNTIKLINNRSIELMKKLSILENYEDKYNINIELEALKIIKDKILLEERNNRNTNNNTNTNNSNNIGKLIYPKLEDSMFNYKLTKKREFYQYKIPKVKFDIDNIDEELKKKCSYDSFELRETQKFLKNFISKNTNYNGLLIYHGVGVGKTCASISIAENFIAENSKENKKIYVLLKPSIRDNYKKSIIDVNNINNPDIKIQKSQCTRDSYFHDIGENNMGKNYDKKTKEYKKLENLTNRIINENYKFFGYGEFVSYIDNIYKNKKKTLETQAQFETKIKKLFSNSVIIIDEVHNITPKNINLNKNTKKKTSTTVKSVKSVKSVKKEDVKKEDVKNEETLTQGEIDGKLLPPVLENILKIADNLKLILLSATPMYNDPTEIVFLINLLLQNDKRVKMNTKDIFNGKDLTEKGIEILKKKASGYISYLRGENPINFPFKLYPKENQIIKVNKFPKNDMMENRIPTEKMIKNLKIVGCDIEDTQLNIMKKYFDLEEGKKMSFDMKGSQICNIVYPDKELITNLNEELPDEDLESIKTDKYYSDKGLKNILKIRETKHMKKFSFKDNVSKDYFKLDNLKKISCKISKLIKGIKDNEPEGIIFIYSQFKASGVYPIVFALESMGYVDFNGKTMLDIKEKKNGMKYLLITGESNKDFNDYKKIENENIDGSKLKIIIGTSAASEGISMFNIREIHVLEPWYHLNRLEQIIGRGMRDCSHQNIKDFRKRNLTVYLYACTYKDNYKETLDLKMYRKAEEKAIKIGKVQRLLKSIAVDCYLNKEGNIFLNKQWDNNLKLINSRGEEVDYNTKDKPFSNICDFMKECNFKCNNEKVIHENDIDSSSYDINFLNYDVKITIDKIKDLIYEKELNTAFNIKQLYNILNIDKKIIYKSLQDMVDHQYEFENSNNKLGYLIYRNKFYIFQPVNESHNIPMIYRTKKYLSKRGKINLNQLTKKNKIKDIKKKNLGNTIDINLFPKFKNNQDYKTLIKSDILDNLTNITLNKLDKDKIRKNFNNMIKECLNEKFVDFFDNSYKLEFLNYIIRLINREFYDSFNNSAKITEEIIERIYELNNLEPDDSKDLYKYLIKNNIFSIDDFIDNKKYIFFKIIQNGNLKYYYFDGTKLINMENNNRKLRIYTNSLKADYKKNINNLYGFLTENQGIIKFKFINKDDVSIAKKRKTEQKRGSICINQKEKIIKNLLNTINSKFDNNNINYSNKDALCIDLELYLRLFQKIDKNNSYFFNSEQYKELL